MSAHADPPPPPPQGRFGQRLLARFPDLTDRTAVLEWLAGLPDGQDHETWCSLLLGWLDGLDMPSGKRATSAAIASMCRQWPLITDRVYKPLFVQRCILVGVELLRQTGSGALAASKMSAAEATIQANLDAAARFVRGGAP